MKTFRQFIRLAEWYSERHDIVQWWDSLTKDKKKEVLKDAGSDEYLYSHLSFYELPTSIAQKVFHWFDVERN